MDARLTSRLCLICLAGAVAGVVTGALSGCAATSLLKFGKNDFPKAGPNNPVVQVMALWQAGEGPGLENKTGRGFVGQVFFFSQQSSVPAQVDGTVRVYVFDDAGPVEAQIKPFHQFDYPPDSWQARMQIGKLGPTYSVFVPYTRKGRNEAHCSLRVRFVPKSGGPAVFSDMVNVVLPGSTKGKPDETPVKSAPKDLWEMNQESPGDETAAQRNSKQSPQADIVPPRVIVDEAATKVLVNDIKATVNDSDHKQPAVPSPPAVPLTEAETRRIVRETMAKLQEEKGRDREGEQYGERNRQRSSSVVQASYEVPANEQPDRGRGHRRPRRQRNPLAEPEDESEE